MDDLIKIIPEKWRGTCLVLAVISPYLTRGYHALANGAGLRGIFSSIWFGTNTPKTKVAESHGSEKVGGWLLIGLVSVGLLFGASGCALFKDNTAAKKAANASDAARITVEAALGMWDSYIVQHHPPIKQQIAVRDAWKKYQAAQLVVLDAALILKQSEASPSTADKSAAQRALSAAIGEAGQSMADLFHLLRTFGVKL